MEDVDAPHQLQRAAPGSLLGGRPCRSAPPATYQAPGVTAVSRPLRWQGSLGIHCRSRCCLSPPSNCRASRRRLQAGSCCSLPRLSLQLARRVARTNCRRRLGRRPPYGTRKAPRRRGRSGRRSWASASSPPVSSINPAPPSMFQAGATSESLGAVDPLGLAPQEGPDRRPSNRIADCHVVRPGTPP